MKFKIVYPTQYPYFNQRFGNKMDKYSAMGLGGHNGIDLQAVHNSPVYASHNGVVTFTGEDGAGGVGIVLRTLRPFEYESGEAFFKTIYWHLLAVGGVLVKAGEQVVAGQLIGRANNTGFSTGDHLHFGLKPQIQGENDWTWENVNQNNGYRGAIDPEPYLVDGFHVDCQYGETNQEVLKVQKFLGVTPTGYYGKETSRAVLKFQIENINLSWSERYWLVGKKVGPKTRTALNKKVTS